MGFFKLTKNQFFQRKTKTLFGLLLFTLFLLIFPTKANAKNLNFDCPNRFVTLVNPVRDRSFWLDQTLGPIENQYSLIKSSNLSATWLLQYDALTDFELTDYLKTFDSKQELGVFLEITPALSNQVKIVYPHATAWANPKAIFLSGYSRVERKKLINEIFERYNSNFGSYPKSVGAWWIDSYSLDYMVKRYGITSAMIVADQKTTDNYGVWGQWWGVPYYPSRLNILVPAKNKKDKIDVIVTQWAQRDFLLAVEEGYLFSNYSLQANDYLKQGKDTGYFSDLITQYLDCKNPISQVTVGLETGMESVGYFEEYKNQIDLLSRANGLEAVTLSDFYKKFKEVYPKIVDGYVLGEGNKAWLLTPKARENIFLNEKVSYPDSIVFADYFIEDSADFLRRYVSDLFGLKEGSTFPYWIFILVLLTIFLLRRTGWRLALSLVAFVFLSYFFVFISFEKYGWRVLFGPQIENLTLIQISLSFLPLSFFYLFYPLVKKRENYFKFLYFLPLTFGFDYLVTIFKFSFLNGFYYFGVFLSEINFIGIKIFEKLSNINLVLQDFDINLASNFLSWSTDKFFAHPFLWVFINPFIHLILAYLLKRIFNVFNTKLKIVLIIILVVFFIGFIYSLIMAEPRMVLPIFK